MSEIKPDHDADNKEDDTNPSVVDHLKEEGERLRQLADELRAHETSLAEIMVNYPHLKKAVYASLREHFERALPPLPDKDLETIADEEGGQTLDTFIGEIERMPEANDDQ